MLCPRSISARAHSLLPIPLDPRIKVPIPLISVIVPCSEVEGAKAASRERVAALIKFIVIIEVRRMGRPRVSAISFMMGRGR